MFQFGFITTLILCFLIQPQAVASRARMQAMNNSIHVVDEQQIYKNPLILNSLETSVTFESGLGSVSSTTTTTSNAAATAIFKLTDTNKLALGLSRQDEAVVSSRSFINSVAALNFQMASNPVDLIFANRFEDTYYGFGLNYSHYKDKLNQASESSAGGSFGIEMGAWQLYGRYLMINAVQTTTDRFDGSGFTEGTVRYSTDTNAAYVTYSVMPVKSYNAFSVTESHNLQILKLGLTDSSRKDGHDPFWGVELLSTNLECKVKGQLSCQKTARSVMLPVWFGIESEVSSWLTLRGSVRQTILFNQSKDDVGYPNAVFPAFSGAVSEFSDGNDNVQINLGAGLKFGDTVVDGLLQAANTGNLNLSSFLTQVSIKYNY